MVGQERKTQVLRLMDANEERRFTGKLIIDYKQGAVMGASEQVKRI